MCYYFDDMVIIEEFDLDNILIDGWSYENVLVYNNSYKSLNDSKPLRIKFDKIDGFNRVYGGTRYLVLFGSEKYDSIYNRIRYLINIKSSIAFIISNNSYDSLTLEKTLTFHDVIILIRSAFNKDKNKYYYSILLEKACYELHKNRFLYKHKWYIMI